MAGAPRAAPGFRSGGLTNRTSTPSRTHFQKQLGFQVTIERESGGADGAGLDARGAKRLAQRIAIALEEAAKEGASGRLIESRARQVIADIYALANRDTPPQFHHWRFPGFLAQAQGN